MSGPNVNTIFVSTASELSTMLISIAMQPTSPPSLYIDLEGLNLSRYGTLSLITLLIAPTSTVYIIDIHIMGVSAFTTPASTSAISHTNSSTTLQSILESATIPKVFFDVRNDSDALFAHYHINLQGIQDLQLMQLATCSSGNRRTVNGLTRCIEKDLQLPQAQFVSWKNVKDTVAKLFDQHSTLGRGVFNERPLRDIVKKYCVQDVLHMPQLWRTYNRRMTEFWREMVERATTGRIQESQSANYEPHGRHKVLGPWTNTEIAREEKGWNERRKRGIKLEVN
ncbi:hypothetical protein CC78DRAFT_608160 [Lojkania enalia]|uniref:3'-5' exonuclease domain-containing protein n=1 Tax=Lojkania enalia TaxID=147567 RepID=A0A9P4N750_9PLEO|nr:hypothetical protein CC78DRAFT_608160 [Didymosphaeria enalia]